MTDCRERPVSNAYIKNIFPRSSDNRKAL